MQLSTLFYGFSLLQGAMATPVAEPAAEVETRDIEPKGLVVGDIPWPRMPALRQVSKRDVDSKDCSAPPANQQGNACSSGTQYCCTTGADGVQTCTDSEICNAKVICCNNNSGFQMCIGEIDFNAPVTININIYKGGKGVKGHYKAIKE
ncbi:hydrophobin [Fusarium acuminatum]|uniref:Hydrophobin n=1 Tax=Fusarium acuminatum TaxID=5515 RepID=A0ABZ2WLG5_9HYPO